MHTTTKIVLAGVLMGSSRWWYSDCECSVLSAAIQLRLWRANLERLSAGLVQGGNCAPYRGPTGGGWRTWNGCPPGYTVQGGDCAPYQGPVGGYPRRRWYGY